MSDQRLRGTDVGRVIGALRYRRSVFRRCAHSLPRARTRDISVPLWAVCRLQAPVAARTRRAAACDDPFRHGSSFRETTTTWGVSVEIPWHTRQQQSPRHAAAEYRGLSHREPQTPWVRCAAVVIAAAACSVAVATLEAGGPPLQAPVRPTSEASGDSATSERPLGAGVAIRDAAAATARDSVEPSATTPAAHTSPPVVSAVPEVRLQDAPEPVPPVAAGPAPSPTPVTADSLPPATSSSSATSTVASASPLMPAGLDDQVPAGDPLLAESPTVTPDVAAGDDAHARPEHVPPPNHPAHRDRPHPPGQAVGWGGD